MGCSNSPLLAALGALDRQNTYDLKRVIGHISRIDVYDITNGAYLEFVYNSLIGDKPQNNIHEYAEGIKHAGPQHAILGTDFGATEFPNLPFHPQAMIEFMEALRKEGISVADLNMMAKTNPARILGLEP